MRYKHYNGLCKRVMAHHYIYIVVYTTCNHNPNNNPNSKPDINPTFAFLNPIFGRSLYKECLKINFSKKSSTRKYIHHKLL